MNVILADKIQKKLCDLMKNESIEILDMNGKIIASKVSERIGIIDKNVFTLIKSGNTMSFWKKSKDKSAGYLILSAENKQESVLYWEEEQSRMPAMAESMRIVYRLILEYETDTPEPKRRCGKREQIMEQLLFKDPLDLGRIRGNAEMFQIRENIFRVPVLFDIELSAGRMEKLYQGLIDQHFFQSQDLMCMSNEGRMILFRALDCPAKRFMQDYKYILAESLATLLQYLRFHNLNYRLYFGPIQSDYSKYRQAYTYCEWMRTHIADGQSFYFYDYIVKYLESMAPMMELETVFGVPRLLLDDKMIDNYIETMGLLISEDYNLQKASENLHVHRNTMVYRLDKIRSVLDMNPLVANRDREFMESFYYYLKRIKES